MARIIDMETSNRLLQIAFEKQNEVECFEGVLQDNYIIHNELDSNGHALAIGNSKKYYKYFFLEEKYLNCYSSEIELRCSNSEKEYDKFKRKYDNGDDE